MLYVHDDEERLEHDQLHKWEIYHQPEIEQEIKEEAKNSVLNETEVGSNDDLQYQKHISNLGYQKYRLFHYQ